MNLDDFSTLEEDRRYIKPEVSLNEQNAFIDNLRTVQAQNNAEIKNDTYNLGTAVPSNLGGLVGGESYFNARYQTPQTNALISDLRSAAQAQALNEAMSNELAKAKERYNKAYKAAAKRAGSGTGTTDDEDPEKIEGKTVFEDADEWEEATAGEAKEAWSPISSGNKTLDNMNEISSALSSNPVTSGIKEGFDESRRFINETILNKSGEGIADAARRYLNQQSSEPTTLKGMLDKLAGKR